MKTTANILIARGTPLWHGDQQIGSVDIVACDHGKMIGILKPGPAFEHDRPLFEAAFSADQAIAQSSLHDLQAAWRAWEQACRRLEQLELSYGDLQIPIEGFAIDADWRVEFETALWWDALLSRRAAQPGSRWR